MYVCIKVKNCSEQLNLLIISLYIAKKQRSNRVVRRSLLQERCSFSLFLKKYLRLWNNFIHL